MMRPNKVRGEVGFDVAGTHIVLKPTFGAMVAIEERMGVGLGGLYVRLLATGLEAKVTGAVLLSAGGLSAATVERLIEDNGLPPFVGPIKDFLANAVNGGAEVDRQAAEEAKKKAEAEAAETISPSLTEDI